jgi:hypothetical protein
VVVFRPTNAVANTSVILSVDAVREAGGNAEKSLP